MKTCAHCRATNKYENRFCEQCGKPFPPPEPEARVEGPAQLHFDLAALFAKKGRLLIGRERDCDVLLPHPSVSRYHALVERRGPALWLRETNSVNGLWAGGHRVSETLLLPGLGRVGVGPFLLSLSGNILSAIDNSRGLRLEARNLEKVILQPDGKPRKLLDNINLAIAPGEFVTLLGPSGSGKSTLMDCLNGRRRATGGQVLANGENFYQHFDNFRQSLGYVPQKDIVHTQLSVYRALYYTAQLRLPRDTDPAELRARLDHVLHAMELTLHRDTLVADLSGGQIKRVSLGAELLAEPSLLYIDEATSGLDAGTEARMMRLFRDLADEGRSVVCITHNVEHVDQCHLVLVLSRGKLVYYGPPREARHYFDVKQISEIYDRLSQRDVADWEGEFQGSSLFRTYVLERFAASDRTRQVGASQSGPARVGLADTVALSAPSPVADAQQGAEVPRSPETPITEASGSPIPSLEAVKPHLARFFAEGSEFMSNLPLLGEQFRQLTDRSLRYLGLIQPVFDSAHQFQVLTRRYLEIIITDRRGLRLLFLQAPVVALFLLVGFLGKEYREPMPRLRDLRDEQRRMLVILQGLADLLDESKPLPDENEWKKLRIKAEVAGLPATVDASQVVRLLRKMRSLPESPEAQEALQRVRFTFDIDGDEQSVTAAELVNVLGELRQSRIPEKLLRVRGPVMPVGEMENPRYSYILIFFVVMVLLWFGCNNAAKEIVKEEAVYARERAVNLSILPYLASKFLVLSAVTALHVLLLMALLYGPLELMARIDPAGSSVPSPRHMLPYLPQYGVLLLLGLTGVALGLLLSACVSTEDRANALLPYVLIPQLILGGGVLEVTGVLYYLACPLSPVYWAYRAVHLGAGELPSNFPGAASYPDGVFLPCVVLAGQTVALLGLTAWVLRRKDVWGR